MTKYYVSGTGNDSNNGLTEDKAFRTLQKPANLVQAGDTVYVMNGTYPGKYAGILDIINKNGRADAPITFTAFPGHTPTLKADKTIWNGVLIKNSSYIIIDGLTLVGARDETTLQYALDNKTNLNNSATSGNGININNKSHHITIRNNKVSKFPGSGIGGTDVDYVTIENNVVSGGCWYSPHGTQGIGFLNAWNSDNNRTNYKIIIKGNTSFDNKQLVPYYKTGKITEGHGIMLDRFTGSSVYLGKTLISHNLAYNNGGAGIHVFKGENPVEVTNNTTYKNSQNIFNGEIFLHSAKNIVASKNIMYGKDGGNTANTGDYTNIFFNDNLSYNGYFKAVGTGNIIDKDPLFVDAANHDFSLKPETPAIIKDTKVVTQFLGYKGN